MQVINKISTTKILGKMVAPSDATMVMRLLGVVSAFKVTNTQLGDSICFLGEFEATNLLTDEVYYSPKAYMPKVAEDLTYAAMQSVTEGGKVNIAFDFAIVPADTPTGYEWRVNPLIDRGAESPLELLRGTLPEVPALPAPKKGKK